MKFSLRGKLYKFTCLTNVLCSGPRKFTKLLKPPLVKLWLDYIKIAAYIDEFITLAYSFDICFKNVWENLSSNVVKPAMVKWYAETVLTI